MHNALGINYFMRNIIYKNLTRTNNSLFFRDISAIDCLDKNLYTLVPMKNGQITVTAKSFTSSSLSDLRSFGVRKQGKQHSTNIYNKDQSTQKKVSLTVRLKRSLTNAISQKSPRKPTLMKQVNIQKLKNFKLNQQISQSYVRQFKHLHRSSFLLNNRLTKSAFDITDAVMIGKPQPFNTFRSLHKSGIQDIVSSLKKGVNKFTKKQSYIPTRYKRALSIGSIGQNKNDFVNQSTQRDRQFFPTKTIRQTQTLIKSSILKLRQTQSSNKKSVLNLPKFKLLYNQRNQRVEKSVKPLSQRKITRIDKKISELITHKQLTQRLFPYQKIKVEKVVVQGKGEIVSQGRIISVIDKLLSILELYFQMYAQDGNRVMDFIKNVEGFENQKIKQILCSNNSIKYFGSSKQIQSYFWIFKSQMTQTEQNVNALQKLPQFFGEQDYGLFKTLNNFVFKLQSKYQNHHRQRYKKVRQYDFQKESKSSKKVDSTPINDHTNYHCPKDKNISFVSTNSNIKGARNFVLQKMKYNPINNNRKITTQMEALEDLGAVFDFKQKGRSIILSERSNIIFGKK